MKDNHPPAEPGRMLYSRSTSLSRPSGAQRGCFLSVTRRTDVKTGVVDDCQELPVQATARETLQLRPFRSVCESVAANFRMADNHPEHAPNPARERRAQKYPLRRMHFEDI